MDRVEIVERYCALPPFPEFPGEREWTDRLFTLEDFFENGPLVADHTREHISHNARELERMRQMFPELWKLLFEAFPPRP